MGGFLMKPFFSLYLDAGVFIPLDLFFAERVLCEENAMKEEHIAFLALLLALSRQGHLAFPLERTEEILQMLTVKYPCDISALAQKIRIGAASLPTQRIAKLVYESHGVFYLQKNWVCEEQIAFQISRLLDTNLAPISLPLSLDNLNSEQRAAIQNAAEHPLTLLFGGPGTGKTYTAAQLIQAFLSQDVERKMRIVVAAPTGKAVAQLDAYLRRMLIDENRIRSGTCHALLGLKKDNAFEKEPTVLFADVILVDECSMIDAPLFSRLLASVLEGTRLILIGDPDQLPSVEAGSIFADLVSAAQERAIIPFAELKKSLRSERSEILCFAEYVRSGQSDKAKEMLSSGAVQHADLDLKDSCPGNVHLHLWRIFKKRFPSFFSFEPSAADLMNDIELFRLLSCMRQGPFGVDAINRFFAEQFLEEAIGQRWWAIPILIVRNDYGLQLYNGDAGVLIRRVASSLSLGGMTQEDYALFPDRAHKDGFRKIPALALPSFEWGYCLSVHKSQGSEYDEVFVLIPEGSDVFGREILYTAATRARRAITCAGALDTIEKVIQNSARKISGLSARLK